MKIYEPQALTEDNKYGISYSCYHPTKYHHFVVSAHYLRIRFHFSVFLMPLGLAANIEASKRKGRHGTGPEAQDGGTHEDWQNY